MKNEQKETVRDLLSEFNWYTLRIGWCCIVQDPQPGYTRLVWENKKTREVRQEYVENRA